jgi:hypothetical protein
VKDTIKVIEDFLVMGNHDDCRVLFLGELDPLTR